MDPNKIRPKERIRENEELSGNWNTEHLKGELRLVTWILGTFAGAVLLLICCC